MDRIDIVAYLQTIVTLLPTPTFRERGRRLMTQLFALLLRAVPAMWHLAGRIRDTVLSGVNVVNGRGRRALRSVARYGPVRGGHAHPGPPWRPEKSPPRPASTPPTLPFRCRRRRHPQELQQRRRAHRPKLTPWRICWRTSSGRSHSRSTPWMPGQKKSGQKKSWTFTQVKKILIFFVLIYND